MFTNYGDIVTINDLCSMLHIGKNRAYEILRNNKIPSLRSCMKGKYLIDKGDVIKYVQSQKNLWYAETS